MLGLKNIDTRQLTANEHISLETKRKFRTMTSEFLPEEFRGNYSMYLTKPDDELVKKYEKFVLDPYFAPLMAESLASELHTFNTKKVLIHMCTCSIGICVHIPDLPEALVYTTEYDMLRDEGIMYANRLRKAGVKCTLTNKMDAIHGCLSFEMPHCGEHRREIANFIREKLCDD